MDREFAGGGGVKRKIKILGREVCGKTVRKSVSPTRCLYRPDIHRDCREVAFLASHLRVLRLSSIQREDSQARAMSNRSSRFVMSSA